MSDGVKKLASGAKTVKKEPSDSSSESDSSDDEANKVAPFYFLAFWYCSSSTLLTFCLVSG